MHDTIHPDLYHHPSFHSPITKHRNRHGGGIALYARASLPIKRLSALELPGGEWIWAQIGITDSSINLCSTYVPPHLSALRQTEFLYRFSDSVAMAQTGFGQISKRRISNRTISKAKYRKRNIESEI